MDCQLLAHPGARRRAYARRERQLAELAKKQHGVISRRQLLAAGLGLRAIGRRVETGRLRCLHRCVYALGYQPISQRGEWMAAVLACGDKAILSHRSAAMLWGLMRRGPGPVDVTAASGRRRHGITVHECGLVDADRTGRASIPVTTVARTLFDLGEVVDERQLELAFEEADRLNLLEMRVLEEVCARGHGRRALRPVRRLIDAALMPVDTQSWLEERVLELCRDHDLSLPVTGARVLGREVDAFWPKQKLMVEADSWTHHGTRAAFERDRARDAAMQVQGFRVLRLTSRRMEREPETIAEEIRDLLAQGQGRAGSSRSI